MTETARSPIDPAIKHYYKTMIAHLASGGKPDADFPNIAFAAGKSDDDVRADVAKDDAGRRAANRIAKSGGEAVDDAEQILAQNNLDSAVPKIRTAAAAMRGWKAATWQWESAVAAAEKIDEPGPLKFGQSLAEAEAEREEKKKQRERAAAAVAKAKQEQNSARDAYHGAINAFTAAVANSLFEEPI